MTAGYQPGFSLEVFHFDIKHHVTPDVLVSNRRSLPIRKDLECHPDILHLFCDSVSPKSSPRSPIDLEGLLNCLGQLNTILVGFLLVPSLACLDLRNDVRPLLEDPAGPPVEGRLIGNTPRKCKLGGLNWV